MKISALARLGAYLLLAGAVSLGAFVVHVSAESTDEFLTPLICQPGERPVRAFFGERKSYSMGMYCVEPDGRRRDESGLWRRLTLGTLASSIALCVSGILCLHLGGYPWLDRRGG